MKTHRFGLLTVPLTIADGGLTVEPVPHHAELAKAFVEELNRDGFFYPPTESQVVVLPNGEHGEAVPNTRRPAFLFELEPSHVMAFATPTDDGGDADAAFVAHSLGYLYGTRLQVEGWSFDGRIPRSGRFHNIVLGTAQAARFIVKAYRHWRTETEASRARLTNLLYMHSRTASYEWAWERFLHEYIVTDAICAHCEDSGISVRYPAHVDRIRECCRRLGVWCPLEAPVEQLVAQRNELTHGAMWEGTTPGYRISYEKHSFYYLLRSLNHRLLAVLLGAGAMAYSRSQWTNWQAPQAFK